MHHRSNQGARRLAVVEGQDVDLYDRPTTRGDCLAGGVNEARPCPFVSCRHHMLLEVKHNGSILMLWGHSDVEKLGQSCSLDLVDALGPMTLEDIGAVSAMTREAARQMEAAGYEVRWEGIAPNGVVLVVVPSAGRSTT
jgi:hypothetical protein